MTVKELIKHLENINPEIEVKLHYDMAWRSDVEVIYLASNPYDKSIAGFKLCIGDLSGSGDLEDIKKNPYNAIIMNIDPDED